ncbi:MAG: hypothetical protein ABIT83_24450 [Massilia sp.]
MLIGLLGCAALLPAHANEFTDYAEVSQRFSKLMAESTRKHRMPRMSDPATAKMVAAMSDHRRFLNARPFSVQEIGNLMEMCETANRAGMAYMLADLDKRLDKSVKDPAKVSQITFDLASRNAVTYQDEITPLLAFHYRCLAKELPLLTNFAASLPPAQFTPERKSGLAQARRGVFTSFVGIARSSAETALSLRNRREMFAVMTEVAPQYIQVLDLATRKQAHDYYNSLASAIPGEFDSQYRKIAKDLGAVTCEGLCRL